MTWNCRLIDYLCGFLCVPPVKEDPRHQNMTSGTWFSFIVKDSGKLWFVIWFCLVCFGWVFLLLLCFVFFGVVCFFRFFFYFFKGDHNYNIFTFLIQVYGTRSETSQGNQIHKSCSCEEWIAEIVLLYHLPNFFNIYSSDYLIKQEVSN